MLYNVPGTGMMVCMDGVLVVPVGTSTSRSFLVSFWTRAFSQPLSLFFLFFFLLFFTLLNSSFLNMYVITSSVLFCVCGYVFIPSNILLLLNVAWRCRTPCQLLKLPGTCAVCMLCPPYHINKEMLNLVQMLNVTSYYTRHLCIIKAFEFHFPLAHLSASLAHLHSLPKNPLSFLFPRLGSV
jgi:hypothetical protein